MDKNQRAVIAEFIGTFSFFFIGMGAVVITTVNTAFGPLGVAFAHGVMLAIMITIFGRVSGGHFNPAVTVGIWVGGKIESALAVAYIAAQLVAAAAAGFLLKVIFTRAQWGPTQIGSPSVASGLDLWKAVLVEAVLTFFLVLAIWGTAVDPNHERVAGFAIGLTVFVDILMGGPLTGAAMNPARWFGPALAAGFFDNWWVYIAGPVAGSIVASLLYRAVFWPDETAAA